MNKFPPIWLGWVMWGLVAVLYMIGYFQRMAPAVMVDELMRDFNIGGALLGNLSAAYFYAYAAMQIPTGLLVDSVGPRRVSTVACVVTAIGILVFAWGPSMWSAYIGRFLIGGSVAVAFVTCMKLAGHWFPANRFATVTGVAIVAGSIGGVMAGVPLSEAVAFFGWRTTMAVSGLLTLVTAAVIWSVVRDDPRAYGYTSYAHASVTAKIKLSPGRALRLVVFNKQTWLLFFAGGLSAAPVLVFAGLWGVPYLTQVHGLDRSHAATITSTMLIALAVGGPVMGALSDHIGRRRLPYLIGTFVAAVAWALLLFGNLPVVLFYPVLALLGFSSGSIVIGFALAREVNHPGAPGVVAGVVNMSVLGLAAMMQPFLGKILDSHWDGKLVAGARIYDSGAYEAAFIWFFVSVVLSVVMIYFTKESYCRISEV